MQALLTGLGSVSAFLTILALYRLKRTEIDLKIREERAKILNELYRYASQVQDMSTLFLYNRYKQDDEGERVWLKEIVEFQYQCRLAFTEKDNEELNSKVLDIFKKNIGLTLDEMDMLGQIETARLSAHESEEQGKEPQDLKKKELANAKDVLGVQMSEGIKFIHFLEKKYCEIEALYPSILSKIVRKISGFSSCT